MIFLLESCAAMIIMGVLGIRVWEDWYRKWKRDEDRILGLADAFDPRWVRRQHAERLKYTSTPNPRIQYMRVAPAGIDSYELTRRLNRMVNSAAISAAEATQAFTTILRYRDGVEELWEDNNNA